MRIQLTYHLTVWTGASYSSFFHFDFPPSKQLRHYRPLTNHNGKTHRLSLLLLVSLKVPNCTGFYFQPACFPAHIPSNILVIKYTISSMNFVCALKTSTLTRLSRAWNFTDSQQADFLWMRFIAIHSVRIQWFSFLACAPFYRLYGYPVVSSVPFSASFKFVCSCSTMQRYQFTQLHMFQHSKVCENLS